jgi:hypothetical protein
MFLDEKPFIYVWRPLYQNLLVPRVYPVLERAGFPIRATAASSPVSTPAATPVQNNPGSAEWAQLETLVLSLLARQDHRELADLRREVAALREQNRLLEQRVMNMESILQTLDARSARLSSDIATQWESTEKLIIGVLSQPARVNYCGDRSR